MQGRSLMPMLIGIDRPHEHDYVGWELSGHRAVRQGDWKIVWDPRERDAARWHLFNLAEDPSEQHDLAADEPGRLESMRALWDAYEHDNGVILLR